MLRGIYLYSFLFVLVRTLPTLGLKIGFGRVSKIRPETGFCRTWPTSSSTEASLFSQQKRGDLVGKLYSTSKNMGGGMTRKNFFVALGGVFLSLGPVVEVYSRLGAMVSDFPSEFLSSPYNGSWDDVEQATLVFHGSGGQDRFTDDLMKKLESSKKSECSSIIEWSQFSKNIFQASFNGQAIGRQAAIELLQKARNLKMIHIVGISVGAFAADAATSEIKAQKSNNKSPFVQLTLLDPFCQRGIFDVGYGTRMFGTSADYAQQYLNTADPVPSTNSPLPNAICFDITDLRPEEISFGHDWPVAYYARSGKIGIVPPDERLSPGTIVKL